MHKLMKYAEKGLSIAASGAWEVFNALNKINQRPAFTPNWSDKPLLKSYEKTKPPLGWPRETDSLCPMCVREARKEILDGKKDVSVLLNERVGEIKATILERDGKIMMVKDCPVHGHFEDVMAIDTAFFRHLDEVRYARKVGYNSVQAATNGIEFAKDPEFAKKAAEAGLRYAYLQFDGIGNAANSHRRVGNLFDVKLRAIENLYNAGVDIVPVITIVNGVNNEQVGRVIEFALDNPKKINFLSFQPVSFTGRDAA